MTQEMPEHSKNASLSAAIQERFPASKPYALLHVQFTNFYLIADAYDQVVIKKLVDDAIDQFEGALDGKGAVIRSEKEDELFIATSCTDSSKLLNQAENIYHHVQSLGTSDHTVTPVHVTAVIGSVRVPDDVSSIQEAISKAKTASLFCAQHTETYYAAYSQVKAQQERYRTQLQSAYSLQQALLDKKVRLAYQPIINSKTGGIAHHECLLRMIDDDGKIMSAGPFIPVAEQMGMIHQIDILVLEMVAEQLRAAPDVTLAFNLSSLVVNCPEWMDHAKECFKDPELAVRAIVEITETAIQKDLNQASSFISSLQDMGCQVALDDFGAGHTSFRQIKALPIDIIKIDGSFVRDIADNRNNYLFVKTLLDITKGLGLKAIAEFVETGEIAKVLMELGVDYLQGNYFCPAVNYRSWVKEELYA